MSTYSGAVYWFSSIKIDRRCAPLPMISESFPIWPAHRRLRMHAVLCEMWPHRIACRAFSSQRCASSWNFSICHTKHRSPPQLAILRKRKQWEFHYLHFFPHFPDRKQIDNEFVFCCQDPSLMPFMSRLALRMKNTESMDVDCNEFIPASSFFPGHPCSVQNTYPIQIPAIPLSKFHYLLRYRFAAAAAYSDRCRFSWIWFDRWHWHRPISACCPNRCKRSSGNRRMSASADIHQSNCPTIHCPTARTFACAHRFLDSYNYWPHRWHSIRPG